MDYLPDAGDLVWVNFDPQAGREQARNRPALVMTGSVFNAATGLLVVCPVTRTDRPWRTRVPLTGTETAGFVMLAQRNSSDWRARGAACVDRAPRSLFGDVKALIATMLDL